MFRKYLGNLLFPPDTAAGSGGTTDNTAGSAASAPSTGAATSGNVTSGSASDAMIKAAMAASSAETLVGDAKTTTQPAGAAGDTSTHDPAKAGEVAALDTKVPDAAKGTSDATDKPGYVPTARHEAVVQNVRRDTEVAVRKQYGNLPPQKAVAAFKLASRMAADPQGFWEELGESLQSRGLLNRDEGKEEAFPEPLLRSEDGKQAAYSAEQLKDILKIHTKQVQRALMGELRPMMGFYESESDRQAGEAAIGKARSVAGAALAEARALPHFKEHEKAIATKLAAMDPQVRQRIGPIAAMYQAYNKVLAEVVFPNVDKQAEERVRANFAKKAAASDGSVHPGGSTGGDGKKPTLSNVSDLAKYMEALAGAAT